MKPKLNIYLAVLSATIMIIAIAALSTLVFNQASPAANPVSLASLHNYGLAPNIQGIAGWINSGPLNMSQLRGKVVLVDFWTYSCINCIRAAPHVEAWYKAYGDNGLVVIGVSTPEFQFEHNYTNVQDAVRRLNITYPVALDNNYSTWDAYGNHYWPADYVIDKNGDVRYISYGEGNYNQTEAVIRALLVNAGYSIQPNFTDVPLGANFSAIGTPEIYFGYLEIQGHGSQFSQQDYSIISGSQGSTANYPAPNATQYNNTVYLSGEWLSGPDGMVAVNNSKIFLTYKAREVNIVASGNSTVSVKLDGQPLPAGYLGADDMAINGSAVARIGPPRLYNIVSAPSYGWHRLEIDASPGFKIYTFTFG